MMHSNGLRTLCASLSGTLLLLASSISPLAAAGLGPHSNAQVGGGPAQPALLPTGQFVTPLAAPGSTYTPLRTGLRADTTADANGAVTTALSPDGKTLLVLTSGYNTGFFTPGGAPLTTPYIDPKTGANSTVPDGQFQWVFVFDVTSGALQKRQQIPLPNAYDGLAWDPSGTRLCFGRSGRSDLYLQIHGRGLGDRRTAADAGPQYQRRHAPDITTAVRSPIRSRSAPTDTSCT